MWSERDLYGDDAAPADAGRTVATAEKVSGSGQAKAAPTISWLALVILFVLFRILYESAGD